MTATNSASRIHVVSARSTNNPYGLINLYCTKVKTKEHSQFVGILSFALFICLTVASFMIYEAEAIFFIVFGIFIYAFLTESLFRSPRPCGVLLYLVFETLQIGFYIATIIFILVELTFSGYYSDIGCNDNTTDASPISPSTSTASKGPSSTPCSDEDRLSTFGLIMGVLVFSILMIVKIYFLKVFTHYYKFISYQEQHSNELRAQYVNGRGVNIGFPDPAAYNNPVINDPAYGYSLYPHTSPLPDLPSYHQAMSNVKPSNPPTTTVLAPPQYSTTESTNDQTTTHPNSNV